MRLITPCREPVQDPVQTRFNQNHSQARSITEQAFGMMKICWCPIFSKALEISPTFVAEVVACCAFLHNMWLDNGDLVDEDVVEPADEDNGFPGCADITSLFQLLRLQCQPYKSMIIHKYMQHLYFYLPSLL